MTNSVALISCDRLTGVTPVFLLTLVVLFLVGCATTDPHHNEVIPTGSGQRSDTLSVATVRKLPAAYSQSEILWGGTIEKIEHRGDVTWVEVVERPLDNYGHPDLSEPSGGRFIAVVPEFLDPVDFRMGMPFAVDGLIEGIHIRSIGEIPYDFPKVLVSDYQLWLPDTHTAARTYRHYHDDTSYRSLLRTSLSIGLGVGSHSFIRFGLSNHGKFYGGYGYHRYGRNHRGHRGIPRHRGNSRFVSGRSVY